jgi:hypothetical protein
MSYKIISGHRHTSVKFHSLSAVSFATHWAHIFVDCMDCNQSIGLKFDSNESSDKMTDDEAKDIFIKNGWIVEPQVKILCPACQQILKE